MNFPRGEASKAGAISVLFAFSANYAQHAAACMASLVRHSRSPLDIVVASTDEAGPFESRIRRSFEAVDRITFEFRRLEVGDVSAFPIPKGLTLETYFRFWIEELMPGRSRAIYLDPDTIVAAPIEELWTTDLQSKALAAVPIPNSSRPATHAMPPGSLFFNAGVLLFDIEAWRARSYRDKCLDYLRRHPERALDGDQDILNLCCIGDWLPLDYAWNVINPFFRPSYDLKLPQAVIDRVCAEPKIIHFNGSHKPWVYLDNHPRQKDYMRNLAQTDWRDWRPADRTALNLLRKRLNRLMPARARRALKRFAGARALRLGAQRERPARV